VFDWGDLTKLMHSQQFEFIEEAPATMRSFTVTQIGEEIGINTIGVSQQLQPLAELSVCGASTRLMGQSVYVHEPEYTHIDAELAPNTR